MDHVQPMLKDVPWYGVRCSAETAVSSAPPETPVPNHSKLDHNSSSNRTSNPKESARSSKNRSDQAPASANTSLSEVLPGEEKVIPLFLMLAIPVSLQFIGGVPYLGYIAIAVVLLAAVIVLFGWGYRQLKQRNDQLEELVEQRTARVQLQARQLARYNAELIRSNKVLQHTVEEKSKVLGVAAHDLKNPIFGIRALSEIMLEEDTNRNQRAHRLSLIQDSAQEALDLIDNLLSSAASSVHGEMNKRMVDIVGLAEVVTHTFSAQAQCKGQTIMCFVPPIPARVEGDENRLREAINNLVSNAVKYAPLDSTIRIDVSNTDDYVHIAIEDEGPGISEHEQNDLFVPFKRLSAEPTGNEGSSGLGLYIVKQIVERHGGTIDVMSTLGKGSTFTIVLPRAEPEETKPKGSEEAEIVRGKIESRPWQSRGLDVQFASPVIGELHR